MKKQIITLVVSSLLIFSCAPSTVSAKSTIYCKNFKEISLIEKNTINEQHISALIDDYFNWHYKSLAHGNNTMENKLCELVANDNLINFKNSKLKWFINWYDKNNESIKNYKTYIKIENIDINKNFIYVNATYGEDLVQESCPEVVQKIRNQEHKIVLKNINNKLMIISDYYDDKLADEIFSVSNEEFKNNETQKNINKKLEAKTLEYNNNIKNIDKLVKEYKSNLKRACEMNSNVYSTVSRKYSSYNGNEAASYGIKYAKNYNTKEYNARRGVDCTNFVSQCIHAGGIPTDGTWYKDSNAWIRVIKLRDWLLRKGYARELDWESTAREGDIVQLRNSSGRWYHSLIITYRRTTTGELFVSAHSDDYVNRALSNYPSTKRFLILTT